MAQGTLFRQFPRCVTIQGTEHGLLGLVQAHAASADSLDSCFPGLQSLVP
jgi:hypothetical protein